MFYRKGWICYRFVRRMFFKSTLQVSGGTENDFDCSVAALKSYLLASGIRAVSIKTDFVKDTAC